MRNPTSPSTVLLASTTGTGSAADFASSNANSSVRAFSVHAASSAGAGLFENSGDGPALVANSSGTGQAAAFYINNPLNTRNTLWSSSARTGSAGLFYAGGAGEAIEAHTQGTGDAMFVGINNATNTGRVIKAQTNGLGPGLSITIDNPLNHQRALYAATNGTCWAGYFDATGSGNGVFISTTVGTMGLGMAGGTKNAVVATSEGARLLCSEEATAVWFSDYGFGQLTDGGVFTAIDPLFAEAVNLDEPYHVFVQVYGDAELYVSQRTPAGFDVRLCAGDPEVECSYRLVAVRRGYEGKRLEHAAWADSDPNLYPAQPATPQGGGAE